MTRLGLIAATVFAVVSASAQSFAQQPPAGGTLVITVVDTTGAVLPGATVTVSGIDAANKAATLEPVQAAADGTATVAKLAPGRYSVKAEFAGFETRTLPDVRVRNGNNKQVLMLPIESHKETVQVGQDKQAAAADPRGSSFGTTLTREQLDALSDDPETLRQQLQEMAGPGAVIKIDSFEGGALPSKSQIRSIRISRDQFAAEHHAAGGVNIEIITQPGMGPIRMNFGYRMVGDTFTGRSPFTPTRGPESSRNMFVGTNGTLVKNKASFSVFFNDNRQAQTPNINVALGNGRTRAEALATRQRTDGFNINGNVDYAVTVDQTLRFGIGYNVFNNRNLGIGQWDEEERAYDRDNANGNLRIQQIGPFGRRGFLRTRFGFNWNDSENRSIVEAPTIRVQENFTSGGAQVRGGQHSRTVVLASDLDYVRGNHTWRTGVQLDAARWRSNDHTNYLGTYTFESLQAYNEGRPRSYTRRIGDPNLNYHNVQGAIYVQDDLRVRRNLTLSAGLRYEAQTHVKDFNNLMPRTGVTWSPGTAGTTTLRASWGIFHDWLSTSTYEQTLRVDGFRQQEIDIPFPQFPVLPELALTAAPVNRYVLSDEVALPRSTRVSLGVDRRYKTLQASATYAYTRGGAVARGLNLNAPVNGIRPDPRFGNVIEVVSDASSRLHQLQTNLTVNQGALFPLPKSAPRIGFKRVTLFLNYTLARNRNNTDGAFSVAPLGDQAFEWGPANNDVRNRFNVNLNNQIVKNLTVGVNVNASSGTPYTLRTGFDENGDLIYNDRPAGVGRNTERAAGHFNINMNVGYGWTFGPPAGGPAPVGVFIGGAGAAPEVRSFDQPARYRIGIFVQAQNLTNHANYTGYSGVMTSHFFRQATSVAQTRRIEAGLNFGF
ncbi:MAG TPA: carboxypeptidase regulatory-like domain-containing protein [Vicinamibacterales bacterium]|nr:carboxypeptidase regulatory-like domain-containing protein [Vicinamibacterales bacterium]